MKTLLFHPTGNNFSRALLRGLIERDLLGLFVTSIVVRESSPLIARVPQSLRGELLRRKFELPESRLWTWPWRELGRLLALRLGARALTRNETGVFSWEAVFQGLDRFVARRLTSARERFGVTNVYCYEDAAFHTFQEAQQLGLRRIYDLPIAYWETSQRLLHEERERRPDWAVTMPGTRDSQVKLERKTAEIEMADVIEVKSK
mgnify:CR=1 FL=1